MSHLQGVNGLKRDFFALFGNNMIYHGITVIFNDTCRVDSWFSTQNIDMKIMFQTLYFLSIQANQTVLKMAQLRPAYLLLV